MKVFMQNTVFKTGALAGLFSFMLVFGGIFPAATVSVHADHVLTAGEVETEDDLVRFVEQAVEDFYFDYLLKEHCDLRNLGLGPQLESLIPTFTGLPDLSPDTMQGLSVEEIKGLIALFNGDTVQGILKTLGVELDIWGTCDESKLMDFRGYFQDDDPRWESVPVYLYVFTHPELRLFYHGLDPSLEALNSLEGLTDGTRDIAQLFTDTVTQPVQNRTETGFLDYCWVEGGVEESRVPDDGNPLTAPGDSWKTSYVVNAFEHVGVPPPADSLAIVFGSGIHQKVRNEHTPPECEIYGEQQPEEMPEEPEMMEEEETPAPDMKTSGGGDSGCAIASGSNGAPLGNAVNLLLIVSALLFATALGSRAAGRRNSIRS